MADQLEATARPADGDEAVGAAHLAGYAHQLRGQGTHAAGTPDLVATAVDEHRVGLVRSRVVHGDADHDAVRAGQQRRMAQTFPHLTVVQATQPHLAGKQPAQTVPTGREDEPDEHSGRPRHRSPPGRHRRHVGRRHRSRR